MRWSQMDDRHRQSWIVAILLWAVALGAFVYMVVAEAPGPAWLGYAVGMLIAVALFGYLRLWGAKASRERHTLPMIMVSALFPQVDRLLRETERRDMVVTDNQVIIDRMRQVLGENRFDSVISDGLSDRYVEPAGFAVDVLDVPALASGMATEMVDSDLKLLLGRPARDVADILSLLYWDRYGGAGAAMTYLWKTRGDALAEPLASMLMRRLRSIAGTVDVGELGTFLRELDMYGFDAVETYVDSRPVDVVDRMMDVLGSYRPMSNVPHAGVWPTTTADDLGKALLGVTGETAQIRAAAAYCAGLVASGGPRIAELLEFLYLRRFDRARAVSMWSRMSTTLTADLASVLAAGPQLARRDPIYARNVDCLTEIVEGLAEYSLAAVQRIVVELRRHFDLARQVNDFVDTHHAVAIDPLELQHVIAAIGSGLPAREDLVTALRDVAVSAEVVRWAATRTIAATGPNLTRHQLAVAALIAAGEFSMRTGEIQPGVNGLLAREAARAGCAPMLLALLVERRYRDPFPEVGVVLAELSTRVQTLEPALVRRVHDRLAVGDWPTELSVAQRPGVGTTDVDTLAAEVAELRHVVVDMPSESALARLRPLLAPGPAPLRNDFDRLYLITFDSSHGPVGAMLDLLSSMTEPQKRRLHEMVEPTATGCLDDVCRRAADRYYTFGHYTRYARLGVLPPKGTFDSFAANFFDDVNCLLHLTGGRRDFRRPSSGSITEWDGVEVNLLSLGEPIRYDLYRVGEPGLREHSPLESDDLFRRVGEEVLKPMTAHRSPPARNRLTNR